MTLAYRLAATLAVLVCIPAAASSQEVFREITSQRLEDILKGMNVQYTKGGDNKGTNWYDYTSNGQRLRLTNFSGKDLMVDIYLPKVDWDVINRWNGNAKFSRARLNKDSKGVENSVIEFNLDLKGGVTEESIKHFIRSFDHEVTAWVKDSNTPVKKDGIAGANETNEETFKNLTADRLEKILNNMNIAFKKQQAKGSNVFYYDYDRNNLKLRLTNFGGDDLMIDCVFAQAPLTKLNDWNIKRNYVRAVLYPGNGNPYTALESNFDCMGGVSENMIRYFINTFEEETKLFDKHLKGQ